MTVPLARFSRRTVHLDFHTVPTVPDVESASIHPRSPRSTPSARELRERVRQMPSRAPDGHAPIVLTDRPEVC
jgi:hypothetical protein